MLASFLVIVMTLGCGSPTGTAGSAKPAAAQSAPGSRAAFESSVSDDSFQSELGGPSGGPSWTGSAESVGSEAQDPTPGAQNPVGDGGATVSGNSLDKGFGSARDVDDPFAVIGPAFSGLGFQSYSSGCDPFEDKYGTCL